MGAIAERAKGVVVLEDKIKHINNTVRISQSADSSLMTSTATKFHDIGRFPSMIF